MNQVEPRNAGKFELEKKNVQKCTNHVRQNTAYLTLMEKTIMFLF